MKQEKIICLGDSLTYGYPYGPHESWVAYAAKACGLNLGNAGVNGDTMEGMAARFERDVLGRKAQAVIVLGGTNDAFCRDISGPMTLSFLRQIINRAVENKILPVIALPIPVDDPWANPKLERICQEYRRVSAELGMLLLDFRTPFIDPDTGSMKDELYLDGVHPNLDGYRVIGEMAVYFFTTTLAISTRA